MTCAYCNFVIKKDDPNFAHTVRTNQTLYFHYVCAIKKSLGSVLDAQYADPYYD